MIRHFSATCGVVICTKGSPKKALDLAHLVFGSRLRTTCYRFSFALPDENCSTPAILREKSYRHIPECNERFARQYRSVSPRKYHFSAPNTHALTENAVKITVASLKPSVARAHTPAFTFIERTETQPHLSTQHRSNRRSLNPICQPNTPRRPKPICQPNTEHHDNKARASERRQACDMDGLQCSRLKVATATKVVVAGDRPEPGASSHHRIIGTMQAHLRSRTVPEDNWCSGFRWCLPYAQRRYTKRSACSTWEVAVEHVVAMEDEVRFFSWLFLFHLRLIEECDVEVLVAPSFRCDDRAFPPLRRHAEPMRRFVVLRRKSSTTSSRHTDSAKNCMACCLMLCFRADATRYFFSGGNGGSMYR